MLPVRTDSTKCERSPWRCSSSTFSSAGSAASGSALADAPTANPASAAPFFRNRLRSEFFGFIYAPWDSLSELLTEAGIDVNYTFAPRDGFVLVASPDAKRKRAVIDGCRTLGS